MRVQGQITVLPGDATKLPAAATPFTLIFLDPPYGKALGEAALQSARTQGWISPDAIVVWEEGSAPAPPQGFAMIDQRRYGDTWVTLLELKP